MSFGACVMDVHYQWRPRAGYLVIGVGRRMPNRQEKLIGIIMHHESHMAMSKREYMSPVNVTQARRRLEFAQHAGVCQRKSFLGKVNTKGAMKYMYVDSRGILLMKRFNSNITSKQQKTLQRLRRVHTTHQLPEAVYSLCHHPT